MKAIVIDMHNSKDFFFLFITNLRADAFVRVLVIVVCGLSHHKVSVSVDLFNKFRLETRS